MRRERWMSKMNLRQRTTLCVAVVVLFVMLTGFVVVHLWIQSANQRIEGMYHMLAGEVESRTNSCLDLLYNTASSLAYSNDMQGALFAPSALERMQRLSNARNVLFDFELLYPDMRNIMISEENGRKVCVTNAYLNAEMNALDAAESDLLLYAKNGIIASLEQVGAGKPAFIYIFPFRSALYRMPTGNARRGNACILYTLEGMLGKDLFQQGSQNFAVIEDSERAFPISLSMSDETREALLARHSDIDRMHIEGVDCVVYTFELPQIPWRIVYAIPRSDIVPFSANLRPFIYLLAAAMVVILIVFFNLFHISHSLSVLMTSVQIARLTGEAHSFRSASLPETRRLAEELNRMMDETQASYRLSAQSQENVYKALRAKDRAEMAFYRTQINPHFLFNTLECIRSMARHCGAEPVETLIRYTSKVLQYSLVSEYIVPFEEELENAEIYLKLMNTRALNAYDIRTQVDPECLKAPMISMVLQPVLENSILHGARGLRSRKFILLLRARRGKHGALEIDIADNGVGIAPDALARLRRILERERVDGLDRESIGIQNVVHRLKLADDRCEIRIRSVEGHFTLVSIRIPEQLTLNDDLRRTQSAQNDGFGTAI